MTAKGAGVGIKDVLDRLQGSQVELFKSSAFGQFYGMPPLDSGAILMHGMCLREIIGDEKLVMEKRLRFEVCGRLLEYGEA